MRVIAKVKVARLCQLQFSITRKGKYMHSQLPWAEHPLYTNDSRLRTIKRDDGSTFDSFDMTLASGEKLIGKVEMVARSRGIPCVDNEQECRDNAALIFKAVNSHDGLLAAVKALLGAQTPQETLDAATLAVAIIQKVNVA
jgi:hypothetical protein